MHMAVDDVRLVGVGVGVVCNWWRLRCRILETWVDLQADMEISVYRKLVQVCFASRQRSGEKYEGNSISNLQIQVATYVSESSAGKYHR
jgi:hypothetical protein